MILFEIFHARRYEKEILSFGTTCPPIGALSDGYQHRQTILSSISDPAHVVMPGVHQVASLLKRWLLGTLQGSLTMEHLQSYLEEFTFRFYRHTSHRRGQLFRRLMEQAVATHPATESDILHGYKWNPESNRQEELT